MENQDNFLTILDTALIRSAQIKSGRHRHPNGDFMENTKVPCGCCGLKPFIPCEVSRGGFSSERTFKIECSPEPIIGISDKTYIRDSNKQSMGISQPEISITGFVQCRKIREENEMWVVEVPSMELLNIHPNNIVMME